MIKFFKINDPYRLVILAIVFLVVRGGIFLLDLHFTFPELRYFLAAKSLTEGKWLYKDIWETTEPLTTLVFYLLPSKNSSFLIVSYWLNVFILIFCALYTNLLLQKLDVINEKTHLPAFFYLFLSLPFIELNTISSAFLASPFLLLVLSNMLSYLKKEETQRIYDASFFLGIATLFHLPCLALVVVLFLSLLVFTRGEGKAIFLLLLGCSFPWFVISVFYLWIGGLDKFWQLFIGNYFENHLTYFSWHELGYILMIPGLVFLSALYLSIRGHVREINYQSVCRKFIFVWMIGGILTCVISPVFSLSLLYLLIFPLTYFYTFYFIQIKKTQLANIVLWVAIGGMIFYQIQSSQGKAWKKTNIELTAYEVESPLIENKKIWVAGDSLQYYLNAKISTKYLNWHLSKIDFDNTMNFSSVESIRTCLYEDLPELIIDQDRIMPKIFNRIPQLREEYELQKPGYYLLVKKR